MQKERTEINPWLHKCNRGFMLSEITLLYNQVKEGKNGNRQNY